MINTSQILTSYTAWCGFLLLLPSVLRKGLKYTVEMDHSDSSLIYCSNYSGQYRVGATILAFPLFFAILANSLVVSTKK